MAKSVTNETSFYRQYRSHKKNSNQNCGGKRIPDVYIGTPKQEDLPVILKYNIPVIIIDTTKYRGTITDRVKEDNQERGKIRNCKTYAILGYARQDV